MDYNDFNYDANTSVAGSIRIGRSVIPTSLLPLIKSLTTLEMILPVIRLTQLDKRSLIGVRLPGVTRLDKAAEIAREYERVINDTFRTTSIAMTGEISVPDLIANITKYRVIPLLGDKGSIEMQEIPSPELGSMDDFDYIKKTIFEGIGVPSGYILGGEGGNDNLKTYVRYLKKVASIQRALVVGLKHVGSVHLRLLGYNVTSNDIEVDFANIISIENLDELEFLDILTSLLKNYYDFIRDLDDESGPTGKVVDWGEVLRFLHEKMKSFAGSEKFLDKHILSLDKIAAKAVAQGKGVDIEPGLKRGNGKLKSEEPEKPAPTAPETSAPTNVGPPEKPAAGGRVTGKPEAPGKFTAPEA